MSSLQPYRNVLMLNNYIKDVFSLKYPLNFSFIYVSK